MGSAGAMNTPEFQVDHGKSIVQKVLTAPQKGADCFNPYITSKYDCEGDRTQGSDDDHETDVKEDQDVIGNENPVDDATNQGSDYGFKMSESDREAHKNKAIEYCGENPGAEYRGKIQVRKSAKEKKHSQLKTNDLVQFSATCGPEGNVGTFYTIPNRDDAEKYLGRIVVQ